VYGEGFEEVELHDLYQALDVLSEKKEALERTWFGRYRDLFTDTDLLYFDTTSTYLTFFLMTVSKSGLRSLP